MGISLDREVDNEMVEEICRHFNAKLKFGPEQNSSDFIIFIITLIGSIAQFVAKWVRLSHFQRWRSVFVTPCSMPLSQRHLSVDLLTKFF